MSARKARVTRRLRERVATQAGYCCGYCRTPERISGARLNIEHIIPEARGGKTIEQNLWLACHACNEFKGSRVQARDPESGKYFDCGIRGDKSGPIILPGPPTELKSLA